MEELSLTLSKEKRESIYEDRLNDGFGDREQHLEDSDDDGATPGR